MACFHGYHCQHCKFAILKNLVEIKGVLLVRLKEGYCLKDLMEVSCVFFHIVQLVEDGHCQLTIHYVVI